MSVVKFVTNALGRLLILAALAAAFLFGLAGVVYMSLQGHEVKVPELTGKNFGESEKLLSDLGLKIKRRAERVSADAPGTVIEQSPRPGETVKTDQTIFVVTSLQGPAGEQTPASLTKTDEDDTEKIEEMISDKPKKPKANSNSNANTGKKKPDTTRDTNSSDSNTSTGTTPADSNKKETTPGNNGDKEHKTPETEKLPANKVIIVGQPQNVPKPKPTTKPNR